MLRYMYMVYLVIRIVSCFHYYHIIIIIECWVSNHKYLSLFLLCFCRLNVIYLYICVHVFMY